MKGLQTCELCTKKRFWIVCVVFFTLTLCLIWIQPSQTALSLNVFHTDEAAISETSKFTSELSESPTTETNVTTLVSSVITPSSRGFWLVMHYSDQGTGGFVNMMSLLCLATKVGGISVVEPFLFGSVPGLNTSAKLTEQVPLGDVFDRNVFNKFIKSKNYDPLVSLESFLESAPRKLVIAQYKCTGYSVCRTCRHQDIMDSGNSFARLNGFQMVDVICFDYGPDGLMSESEFEEQLYSKYHKSEVVVLFAIFAGVYPGRWTNSLGYLLNLTPSTCWRNGLKDCLNYMEPSSLVKESADKFKETYLGSNHYISVMLRFELILRDKFNSKDAKQCLTQIENRINGVKSQFGIAKVVLFVDIGLYGSTFFSELYRKLYWAVLGEVNGFISRTMKEGMDLAYLDEMFTNTTKRRNPGFVAVMQKVIASRGDVLMLLGGAGYRSSYQQTTEKMYRTLHPKPNVIISDNNCV